jgi:hypothetical protein
MVLLIEYTDHLGANLAGCGTVTVCVYEDVMHEGTERGEGRYTVSGRGAAGTASHVGDLREGSDMKSRSALGQRRSRKWRRRRSFLSLLRSL